MRVVLLYPEVYDMARFKEKRKEFPPFGVLYLAAVAENAGHEVAVEAVTPGRTTRREPPPGRQGQPRTPGQGGSGWVTMPIPKLMTALMSLHDRADERDGVAHDPS